jgi:hypothetical protein
MHIAPAIGNDEDENLSFQNTINDSIGFEVYFPKRPVPQLKKFSRIVAATRKRGRGRVYPFNMASDFFRSVRAVVQGDVVGDIVQIEKRVLGHYDLIALHSPA